MKIGECLRKRKKYTKNFFKNLWFFGQIFPGLLSYKAWNSKILKLDIQTSKLQRNLTMGMSVWLLFICLNMVTVREIHLFQAEWVSFWLNELIFWVKSFVFVYLKTGTYLLNIGLSKINANLLLLAIYNYTFIFYIEPFCVCDH